MNKPLPKIDETNPLGPNGHNFDGDPIEGNVYWNDPRLAQIERLRLLSDPGFPCWDVSYCHGRLKDGKRVNVSLPFNQLKRNTRCIITKRVLRVPSIMQQITSFARKDKVFAKGLGINEALSTLV